MRLKKTFYGLKQTPRAWYECLTMFLVNNSILRGGGGKTLFITRIQGMVIIAQVYTDDIIFGSTTDDLAKKFIAPMQSEFEKSLVGKDNFFLFSNQTNDRWDLPFIRKICQGSN